MSEPRMRHRFDDDPVHVVSAGRITYWTGGEVSVGERKFLRCGSAAAAEATAEQMRADFARLRAAGPLPASTLHQLMAAMVAHLREVGAPKGSLNAYRSNWNCWVPEEIRLVRCCDLTLAHWTAIFDNLNYHGAGPGVVRAVQRTLNKLIGWGINRGYLDSPTPFGDPRRRTAIAKDAIGNATRRQAEQPLEVSAAAGAAEDGHELPDRDIELKHCPDWSDVEKYALAFEALYPGYGYRLVIVAYATGMRLCELLALRVENVRRGPDRTEIDVDWQLDRYNHWPAVKLPKNDRTRPTIIWEAFWPDLESLIADALARDGAAHGWLFPPLGDSVAWADMAGHLGTAAKEASGWKWKFHWLRHAFASVSMAPASAGGYDLDEAAVSEWLGHAKLSTTLDMYRVKPKDATRMARIQTHRHPGGDR